jgi:hypothetical protein
MASPSKDALLTWFHSRNLLGFELQLTLLSESSTVTSSCGRSTRMSGEASEYSTLRREEKQTQCRSDNFTK